MGRQGRPLPRGHQRAARPGDGRAARRHAAQGLRADRPRARGRRRAGRPARPPGRRPRVPQLRVDRAPRRGDERAHRLRRGVHRRRLRAGRARRGRPARRRRRPASRQRALLRRGAHPVRAQARALARGPGEDAGGAQAGAARRPLRVRRVRRRAPLAADPGRVRAAAAVGHGPALREGVREPRPPPRGAGPAVRLPARRHQDPGGVPDDGCRPGGPDSWTRC